MIPNAKVPLSHSFTTTNGIPRALKFILPTRLISVVFGVSPFRFTNNGVQFSAFHFLYGTILMLSTSISRIYLTPAEPRSAFFYQVLYYKQILLPVSCILSYIFGIAKYKKFNNYFTQSALLEKYVSLGLKNRMMYFQIFLIVTAFASFTFVNLLMYFLKPDLFYGPFLIPRLLDYHLSMTLWVLKLQFFTCMLYMCNVLQYVRHTITNLPKFGTSFVINRPGTDFNSTQLLFDQVVTLAENLVECYGVTLGVASLLTALSCITTAYVHVMTIIDEAGPFLVVWLVIDFAQEWMILSGAEIFLTEMKKIPIAVHQTMREVNNQLLLKQLKQFSNYLMHRQVKFTICGMVSLDYSLLFTIAGAVTTYMVVLVQFQKTENSSRFGNSVNN